MEDHTISLTSYPIADGTRPTDILQPTVLLLSGQHVVSKAAPEIPIYEMSRDVTSIPSKNSSITFKRVEDALIHGSDIKLRGKQNKRHIFYLAHPAEAECQTGTSAYYITSASQETALGNISLRSTKSLLQRPGLEAEDKPLFEEDPR